MNVYLYQNNTEKVLKNIYIGEYKSRLPSAYQEVEWIGGVEGNNNRYYNYINTGITANSDIGCDAVMLHTATLANVSWFLTDDNSSTTRYGMATYPSGNWCPQRQTWHQTNVGYSINTRYDIKFNYENNKQTLIDGTNIYSLTGTFSSNKNIMIGFGNQGASYGWKCKSFKMTNGTTLVRDFVPCYRKSDSVIGMYDLVNNQFYTNAGSGTFTKGPDVN